MKKILPFLLIPTLAVPALAQEETAFLPQAVFSNEKGETFVGWVVAATEKEVRYRIRKGQVDHIDARIKDFTTFYLLQDKQYTEALDLFESGKYKEALEAFQKYKVISKPVAQLPNNYHTLAGYYELECLRNIGDLQGLATALQSFIKKPLLREDHLRQLDLYVMWDAVRAEDWGRVVAIGAEMDEVQLIDSQRVQVGYCKGLGLQKLNRTREALNEYGIAISIDAGGSRTLSQQAAINSLQIYFDDPEVQVAIKNWKIPDENKNSFGYARLLEAGKLAKAYESLIKSDKSLPKDYAKFLDYAPADK